ncbi:unnamed protein product [Phytophthora lilii]|uniref:Unnamed protein product n=1 Tax=Phytophthora lilii TaxID=2077276 RepID=A0A9W6TQC3_9STRA|nr:unnamed protein product [Phytophthora lilii]
MARSESAREGGREGAGRVLSDGDSSFGSDEDYDDSDPSGSDEDYDDDSNSSGSETSSNEKGESGQAEPAQASVGGTDKVEPPAEDRVSDTPQPEQEVETLDEPATIKEEGPLSTVQEDAELEDGNTSSQASPRPSIPPPSSEVVPQLSADVPTWNDVSVQRQQVETKT